MEISTSHSSFWLELETVKEPKSWYACTSKLYANAALGEDESMETALQAVHAWYEIAIVGDVHRQPFMADRKSAEKCLVRS